MADESVVDFWAKSLVNILTDKKISGSSYKYRIVLNNERHLYEVVIIIRTHGIEKIIF